jgi:hypothetical protein
MHYQEQDALSLALHEEAVKMMCSDPALSGTGYRNFGPVGFDL